MAPKHVIAIEKQEMRWTSHLTIIHGVFTPFLASFSCLMKPVNSRAWEISNVQLTQKHMYWFIVGLNLCTTTLDHCKWL